MSNNKQRLELTWIGKNNPEYDIANIEPRILEERPELSNCTNDPNTENMIIHGDNLLALKALLPEYEGMVKCVFIDPPYNTGSAFAHYDDSVEHSTWLSLMRPRLELLRLLLSDDGSIWITIDDNESHYLKVVCDEVFGRQNYITSIAWEKDKGRRSDATFSISHDYILIYAKNPVIWSKTRNLLERTKEQIQRYRNPDNDPRGDWLQGDNGTAKSSSEGSRFPITLPSGRQVVPPASRGWSFSQETFETAKKEGRVYFGMNGDGMPILKRYLSEVQGGVVPRTWWPADDAGHNQEAKRDHLNKLLAGIEPFATPKPERLLQRILTIATNPGDLILDSFLGSGTTSAVAHKMGRKYIGIEMGDHAYTHCKVRLDKVIDGSDKGGISEAVNWKGGGAYRFYELAPSFVTKDEFGNPVIDDFYNDSKLIRAMCKLMNFTFSPSSTDYWKHGIGQGKNYLYVTTQLLTSAMIQQIAAHLAEGESLIICPKKFEPGADKIDNRITVKKIPQSVLKACHFGKKEYLLPIKETALEEVDLEGSENE